jgi:Transglycosylase SLT domain
LPDLFEMAALGAFAGLVGWAIADGIDFAPHPTAQLKGSSGCKGASDPELAQAVAEKWGPRFGCPVRTLLIIGAIESGYRPACSNISPQGMTLGGAWGMFQQMRNVAAGHARALASSPDPDVQTTLRKWTGAGPDLFDPDLCGLFAARQLGQATAEFGDDIARVAGAYHQGAGKIRSMIAQGRPIPAELPPHGKTYVTRALQVAEKIG